VTPHRNLLLLLLPSAILAACGGKTRIPPAPQTRPYALRRGEILYERWCSACHGRTGRGDGLGWNREITPGPSDLAPWKDKTARDLERLFAGGGTNGPCPSWKANFTPSQIRDLAAFLKVLPGRRKKR